MSHKCSKRDFNFVKGCVESKSIEEKARISENQTRVPSGSLLYHDERMRGVESKSIEARLEFARASVTNLCLRKI